MPVLHLLVLSLMWKSAQNNSSNSGPDAALEGTLLRLSSCCTWWYALALALKSHWRCIRRWRKDAFYVAFDGALQCAFAIAIEDATEVLSEGTPKGVPWDLYKDAQERAFEVEVKGAFEVTIEVHLKIRMVVHL